ncbi:hypothetical protein [Vibrio parahaemolyticus]|uniref:hypothetical protein n=1 Tax=Vibrio parahaemolyticus TaxID=670 RepID=UPI0001BC71F7|nr:hypothetical protein [Vibrio parahaemolyticus]EFO42304.1 conserved hypothetical protein [Vibrio parahaemolyticus AN-5034]
MAYNISLNNITTTTAPVQQELSGISLQTSASALPRVDIQPNVNEHQLPQALSPSDSCLENEESSSQQPEVKKEQAEKKKKVHKKSNKYSNHTKAKGHLAAIAGATTLGAVLAPFTGGLSLLPTAFVVLFGNASALAMYGGSEFVLGQKGPNNQIDDKKDPEANKQPEENKQPEISVPVSPRPIRAQEFRGLDEVNGRREPEPEEKGSRGKGDTFNYSPVFNFNFGDLNFNQFNTQNNTQFNTQNNTDKTNQADTDSSPTLIEQTIEKFGGNPVINVEEITKDVLIRELREQEPLIGPESKVDEMIDALVSFHEQTNEAKLIQVSFESGHKAYIGGIPDTDEQKQTDPIKAEVCVEKAKKQWPEVKPAHRLITTSGNAKIDGNPGYRNARVDVDGQTVGYTRNERGGSQPQSSGVHTLQGSQQPSVEPSPVDPGHGASGAASAQPGGEAKGAQTPSLHTQGEPISTATQTGGAQGTQGGEDDGRPQVAQGHNPQGEPASLAKAGTPVDPGHGASDVASAQPGGEAKGTETPSLQTEGESISTSMPTGEEQGVQTGGVKKWPEVAAPQRVITSAGNAKIDGNPGYRNARVDVDGQTVGYTRNERGGSQPQSSGVHTLQGSQQPSVEPSPVDPGHGASGAASAQPGGEAKGAQTPGLHTQGEPISTATQTGGAQGTQGGEDDGRPQVAQGHNPQGEPASLAKAGTPVDPGHGASDVASAQPGGEAKGTQTPSLQTEGESISTSMPTGEEQGVQTGGVKKWPEVAAPQRVITSAGNAKIDGNPGYRNARVDVDGQTVGYTRNERGGSQPQSSGVHTSQGSQQPGVEPSPVDPGHGASGAASVQPGGEAKGAQTPSLHTQGEPISTATQTGGAQGTQGGEDDGRPQVAQGHNPQGEPASLAKAGTPVEPGHGASDVASAQSGGEAKGAQTPSLHTQGEPISTATQTGGAQGTQGGEDDGRPQVAQGHNPQGEPASLAKAGTPVDPGHGASGAASAQPGGEAKGAQTPGLHTQGEPISTATQTGGAQGTQGGEDDGRPQVAQGHNPQGEPASLAKAGTPVDPGHGASDVASAQPGGEAKGTQTPSLQTEGESISTSMPTGEEQGVQTGGVKKWPEVAAPQRVITSAGNAKIDGNPGYRNARVDVDGQTVGYTRNERGGSQPQSSGVHTSQGSQQPGVEPSPVDPGHGASGAASVQPGGEAKGAQTPSLHTQGEPISTATQTGGAQNIQSVTLARADLQQTNVERGRITDVTKLVDVQALASTVAANKSEPERFVSKLHITLKGNSSADSKVGTNQPESLQAWSSNMLSHGPGVKLAQKSLVQNEIELMPQANNGETVKKIEVVSNISGKKWTVSMPAPVLTTQGMASGRGKNYTQGLFHNIRDINQTKRNIELNSTLMESTPKSDVSFVNMGDKVIPIKPAIISNLKLVS